MVNFVTGVAFKQNEVWLNANPKTVQIPCVDLTFRGEEWCVPQVQDGRLLGYARTISASKPSPDSVKALRVCTVKGDEYLILVSDSDTQALLVTNCNDCCGPTPILPAVTVPAPIIEDKICPDASGNYTFIFPVPQNPNTLKYLIPHGNASFNGQYATPDLSGAGYSSVSALVTALNTNWSAYGTFTAINSNKDIQLVSTTTVSAGLYITLLAAAYCCTLPGSPTQVDGIIIGGTLVNFTTIQISTANGTDLINAIAPYLYGTLANAISNTKVQYTGLLVPGALYFQGAQQGSLTFTAGVCS